MRVWFAYCSVKQESRQAGGGGGRSSIGNRARQAARHGRYDCDRKAALCAGDFRSLWLVPVSVVINIRFFGHWCSSIFCSVTCVCRARQVKRV